MFVLIAGLAQAATSPRTTLSNERIGVALNPNGTLISVLSPDGNGVYVHNDSSFVVALGPSDGSPGLILSAATCPGQLAQASPTEAVFLHKCPSGHSVQAAIQLNSPSSGYLAKTISVTSPASATSMKILSVAPFGQSLSLRPANSAATADAAVQGNAYYSSGDIAVFARFGASGAFVSITNPFFTATAVASHGEVNASCTLGRNHVGDDLPGSPIKGIETAAQCESLCAANPLCKGYVWVLPGCEGTPPPGHCYLKASMSPQKAEQCTCLASKPFQAESRPVVDISASYEPLSTLNASQTHVADVAVLGLTTIGMYRMGPAPNDAVYVSERQAFVDCVSEFLLDGTSRQDRTVKVNVAWDENDYQIDVGTESGVTEYKRIIDRNAEFGVTHIVYEPQNSLHASRFNSTDGWGWEAGLWFGMGEVLREGKWDPVNDPIPGDILDMTQYASSKGIKLLAYVYPCLHFSALSQYFSGNGIDALDLGVKEVQDWMITRMLAFMSKSGSGGWAWDHDIFTSGATPAQRYAQWRGWMRILAALREKFPDLVMDHRQTAHIWGPWYQLAGSYLEPIAGDENPETYGVPIASLHTDHVAADNTRIVNYKYSVGQLQPSSRIPGFIFHQTERTADNGTNPCFGSSKLCYDSNTRDFDLLGYKYSLLSTIGTAGQNNVLTMIPARDIPEFQMFPDKDLTFIRDWLAWTDAHLPQLRMTRPIATLGPPALGSVDGTCAIFNNSGFLFLFNPNMYALNVTLNVDESIGISATSGEWTVAELYPQNGTAVGLWHFNQTVTLLIGGSSSRVLKISHQPSTVQSSSNLRITSDDVAIPHYYVNETVRAVQITHATAVSGSRATAVLHGIPLGMPVILNGVRCNESERPSTTLRLTAQFEGVSVRHAMPISDTPVPPGFDGGLWKTSFTVPPAISAQLAERRQSYPIPWTPADYKATWLVPERLLLNVFLEKPSDEMNLTLSIDGVQHALTPSYNSRGLVRSRCFLGWYLDATNFTRDTKMHQLELILPKLAYAGQFQGCYWGNVETEYTSVIDACNLEESNELF